MTEEQIIDYLKYRMKKGEATYASISRGSGYHAKTINNWLSLKTKITLDGLESILSVFDEKPVVKDRDCKIHFDILEYLPEGIKGHEKEVYGMFAQQRYGKDNIKKWVKREHGIKVYMLVDILDIIGAELLIIKKAGK